MTAQTLTTNLNADNLGFSFIGVGSASATGMRSQIGNVMWTASTLTAATGSWTGLAYGDGYAVALNSNALTNITVDNGTTAWLSYGSIPSGTAWGQLAYGNGYFVSVNSASTTAARMVYLVYRIKRILVWNRSHHRASSKSDKWRSMVSRQFILGKSKPICHHGKS